MYVYRICIVAFACFLLSACDRKAADHSTITIQFDRELLAQGIQAPPSAKVNATNTNGPNWGLSDPTSLSQIDCYGVFVGGPENFMQENTCTNYSGQVIAKFGPRAGFFPLNSEGKVEVPAGEKRRIFLVGMASADGTCESGFDHNTELQFANYSNPFILGLAVKDLLKAEERVEIKVVNNFDPARKLNDCNFIDDDHDDGTHVPMALNFYETKRTQWIIADQLPRKVQVTHSGESLECSRDGGSTFGACDGTNLLIWMPADYNNQHQVRARYSDGTTETLEFTPSSIFPGVSFHACDLIVPLGATDFTAFSTMLATNGKSVCFRNGAVIASAEPGSATVAANTKILSFHGGQPDPVLENTAVTGGVLKFWPMTSGDTLIVSGMKFVGIPSIDPVVEMQSFAASGSQSIVVEHSEIISNSDQDALNIASGGATMVLDLNESTVHADNAATRNAIYVGQNAQVNISRSIVTSSYIAIKNYLSNVTVDESHLTGVGPSSYTIYTLGSSTSVVNNSIIEDQAGTGLKVDCYSSALTATAELNGNLFVRGQAGGINAPAIQGGEPGGCSTFINSTDNDNLFCSTNPGNLNFSAQLGGVYQAAPSSTYSESLNNANAPGGNAMIGLCPPFP